MLVCANRIKFLQAMDKFDVFSIVLNIWALASGVRHGPHRKVEWEGPAFDSRTLKVERQYCKVGLFDISGDGSGQSH